MVTPTHSRVIGVPALKLRTKDARRLETNLTGMINMASCLVPDFPAVMVALEHLKELDKQLKEDGAPFSPEASFHLTEITAAITKLEADRCAAHEQLEVETIENSKLRHQIGNIRHRLSQEITDDVAAARASNAEEMEQLHKELIAVSQLQDATMKRQEALQSRNEALHPERERAKSEHDEIVAFLNDQITLKYGSQLHLEQTQEHTEELKSRITAVEQDKVTLQQNMVLEREAFTAKRETLSRESGQVEGKIKQRKQEIKRSRRELDRIDDRKRESQEHLGELTLSLAKLEGNLRRLTAARCECEKQLEGETQKQQDLRQQREMLKRELSELRESFSSAVQSLKDEIGRVEDKIEEGRASRLVYQDSLAQILDVFKHQREEEDGVRAEHFLVWQQLERSRLQLEERIATIVKHSQDIKDMDKQITELLEADTINKRVFERNQEEMCGNVDTEKKNISHFEDEISRLKRLLKEAKRTQVEHEAKMNADIDSMRRRFEELLQEEAALQQRQPKSVDADLLISHMAQCEADYIQEKTNLHQEIEQCAVEFESITRRSEEKQKEVKEKEEVLKEVETKWNEERSRHQRLDSLVSELRMKRETLEGSIQELKEKTSSLLRPKEENKAELEQMRGSYMEMLDKQASELRAVELSIYDNSVKLEQVNMENSRLHLSVRQMTEGVSRARQDRDRCLTESRQFRQDAKALFGSLQEAWREDVLLTEDRQSNDSALLTSVSTTINRLKNREQQLDNVGSLSHQQMLDFSRRLGNKTTIEQKS